MTASRDIAWGSHLDPQLSRLIEQDFARLKPVKPSYQPRFESGSLPDAAVWEGCTIYCPDTKVFKGSNGTAWVNL